MIGAHHFQRGSRGWLLILLRWAAAILVIGVLLHFLPLAPLRAAIWKVPVWRFVAVLLVYLLAHSMGVAKWRMVVNVAGAGLDAATSAQCYTGGLFGTLFLPSIIGGDVVRLAVGLRRSARPAAVLAIAGLMLLPGSLPAGAQAAARHLVTAFVVVALAAAAIIFAVRGALLR